MNPEPTGALPAGSPARKRTVFVIEDHPLMRRSIIEAIRREPDLAVCGQAEDAPEPTVIMAARPDVVLTDIQLKSSNGLELIRQLRSRLPDLPIVATTMFEVRRTERLAREAGASGFIGKDEGPARMISIIREVLNKG